MNSKRTFLPAKRNKLSLGLVCCVLSAGLFAGCSQSNPVAVPPDTVSAADISSAGGDASGTIGGSDLGRLRYLAQGMTATGTISDTDLGWALNLLRSNNPVDELHILGLLLEVKNPTPTQKASIIQSVTPLASSSSPTVSKYATAVLGKMQ